MPADDARLRQRLRCQRQREFVRDFVHAMYGAVERASHLRRIRLRHQVRFDLQALRQQMHSRDRMLHDARMPDERSMLGEPMPVRERLQALQGSVHRGDRVLRRHRLPTECGLRQQPVPVQEHVQGLQRHLHSERRLLRER